MISCSNLYQDLTTTTVEFTKESIASIKSRTSGSDENCVIFATVTCGKKTQTKTVDIADIQDANGVTLQFDKLPVGKTGTLYVSVGSKKAESIDIPGFYSENIADLDGKTQFRVQPNGNTKIKVSLKENEERFFADFLTFPYNENMLVSNIELNFTENSTITAPLPVGTTRWQIYHNDNGNVTYLGDYGKKIDVAKDLIQYKEYFINPDSGEHDTVCFEATGNPMNQIKTPVVYSSFDSNSDYPYLYNFANSLEEVGKNTEPLFNLESEDITDYCFDNAGNLYFIYYGGAYKLAYDFDTNSYESAIIEGKICYPFYSNSNIPAQGIIYDKAQNTLYLLTYEQTGGNTNLVKFSNPAGTIYKTSKVSQAGSTNFSLQTDGIVPNSQSLTAHNGKIYVAYVRQDENGSSYNLVLQEYKYVEDSSNNSWEWTSEADITYPIDVKNTDLNFTTDIMFQDGSLYIIFRCYNTYWLNDNKNYSTGGILKYDISSQTFDGDFRIKGFATESSFESKNNGTITINYFAPTFKNETQVFYGPTKFVAIMPKKLVFLDQGADVKDKEAGKLSTKSRIVEYDLSTNTFSSKEFSGKNLSFSYSYSG